MKTIEFFVPGIPATAGSKTGFYNPKTKRVIMAPANKKQKPWMAVVRLKAEEAYQEAPLTGSIILKLTFCMPRPKSHYGTGRNSEVIKESSPSFHTKKPDLGKLTRCVEDALTGIIWRDDSQVFEHKCIKIYSKVPIGVSVTVKEVVD